MTRIQASYLALSFSLSFVLAQASVGCKSRSTAVGNDAPLPPAAPSGKPPKAADIHAVPEDQVRGALNPDGEKPYSGPIGSVRGVVHVSGDSAPELPEVLREIPAGKCADARSF
jgi:hypothetical protein